MSEEINVDQILIDAVRRGDEKAFEILLSKYQESIRRFSFRFLGDEHAANDIAQETFLKLYLVLQKQLQVDRLPALLFKIAKNCCIDFKRKQRFRFLMPNEMPVEKRTAYQVLNLKEQHLKIETALQNLPENQRAVILLRHTESMSYEEIAQVMSTTTSAIESLLFRARKKLRRIFSQEDFLNSLPEN